MKKRHSSNANTKMNMMNQMLELSENDFKAAVIKMLLQSTTNFLEKKMKIEDLRKVTEAIKKNQMEIIELKNRVKET